VERIFVSTNSLPTQAQKKQTNPFFPYFESWANPVAGWNNFVDQSQTPPPPGTLLPLFQVFWTNQVPGSIEFLWAPTIFCKPKKLN